MVKRWDSKTVATATAASSDSSAQRHCSLPGAALLCRTNNQTTGFPEQVLQVPNTRPCPRTFIQSHPSGSSAGYTCLANIADQTWLRLLGSFLRAITAKWHGRRQSQEGVGGQGGRKGRRRRRACITTEAEEGHGYEFDDDLSEGLPEVRGSQVLPNTCDRNFGGEHEELEHLEARSIVIFLVCSSFSLPAYPLLSLALNNRSSSLVFVPPSTAPYRHRLHSSPLSTMSILPILDFSRCYCGKWVSFLLVVALVVAPRPYVCILANDDPPSFPFSSRHVSAPPSAP